MKTFLKTAVQKLSRFVAAVLFGLVSFLTNVGSASAQVATFPAPCSGLPVSQRILALDSNNNLFTYNPNLGAFINPIKVNGIKGNLQGVDFRPANNQLYGITDTDQIYLIDPGTGDTKLVSTLPTSFDAGFQSLMDFNPVLDALRLIGSNDQNLAVVNAPNADLSVTNPQLSLVYADGDRNEGVDPNITAGAYNNNFAGARQTTLFNIDSDKDVLTTQNPTANGINATIGSLGVNFAPVAGMDIYSTPQGVNAAVAVSGTTLYCVNLNTGAATMIPPLDSSLPVPLPILRTSNGGFIDVAVSTSPVLAASVTLAAQPLTQSVTVGQSASYGIRVLRGTFSGAVNLAVSGLPPGATAVFEPNPVLDNVAKLAIDTSFVPAGSYNLTISGFAPGANVLPTSVTLNVLSFEPPIQLPTDLR